MLPPSLPHTNLKGSETLSGLKSPEHTPNPFLASSEHLTAGGAYDFLMKAPALWEDVFQSTDSTG